MLPLLHLSSLSGAHKHQENHRSVQGLHCLQATLSFLPMRVAWSCVTFDALNLEPGRDRLLLGKGRGGVRLLCGVSGLKKYTGNLQVPDRSTTVDVNTHNYNVHHGIPPQTYVHPGYRCALHRVAPGIRHSSYNQTSKRCTTAPHHIKYTLYTLQTLQQHTTAPNRHDTLSSTHISFPWSFLPLLPLPAHQSVFLFLHTPSLFASPSLSLSPFLFFLAKFPSPPGSARQNLLQVDQALLPVSKAQHGQACCGCRHPADAHSQDQEEGGKPNSNAAWHLMNAICRQTVRCYMLLVDHTCYPVAFN